MPLFDFQCESCNRVEQYLHDSADECPERCCVCGGVLKRLWNAPVLIFRGPGFYVNDSKKEFKNEPTI
ncbi:MAG: FmdB family transcriptional regulator [Deltaproteobacteria bacterium]|nr:FmdB family transcriptional regulator [Deltaproteobacteria bacterium]